MIKPLNWWRCLPALLVTACLLTAVSVPNAALAGTTGNITGVVKDTSGKPVADVTVAAASLSQALSGTTDAHGYYSLVNLIPDTYTVSFQKTGYQSVSVPGITVLQDQSITVNQSLQTELKTIASVRASGTSNLVKPEQGSDVYTIGGAQLSSATNPVGSLETIYQWMAVTPGVTSNGFPAQPRIRGGQVTDLGYEFEGIPIQDRMVGFFTTNLSNTGLSNVEIYTGGLSGAGAINGTGYFNSVLKTGTYPSFSTLSLQASAPEQNQYLTFEYGTATPDRRYSAYIGFTGVNSANQYDYGEHTYPGVIWPCFCDGPGPVKERNWVGNFHYHPNQKNDFQVVITNDLGDFDFSYLLNRASGEPLPLAIQPCPGAVSSWSGGFTGNGGPSTGTYGMGGTAANGQPCPLGIQYSALGNGQGNLWHHYGGLGKIQWNHNIDEHSFFNLRLAENFNQYIFDQPMADLNIPSIENPGAPYSFFGSACPNYPYVAGTPVQFPVFSTPTGPAPDPFDMCAQGDGVQVFYGDRRSNIYEGALDYTNALSDRVTIKAGVSHEYDHNIFHYVNTHVFTINPNNTTTGTLTYPGLFEEASYPTIQDLAYANGQVRFGKLMIDPGLTWAQRHYAFPADQLYATGNGVCPPAPTVCTVYSGGYTAHTINPTFNGTYSFSPNDVLTFSWGDTTSFVGSAYVYTSSAAAYTGFDGVSTVRNPFLPGTTFSPQMNHAAELLWEHNFGNNTTLRVGPYYNKTTNYYSEFKPFLGYFITPPCNNLDIAACTPCSVGTAGCAPVFAHNNILTNNNEHQTFGAEFGLNHDVSARPRGTSYWVSATYNNFWTTATDISAAYINFPLPENITRTGLRIRSVSNPLWSGTLLADFHEDRFHLQPLIYYQGDTFFNTGVTCNTDSNGNTVAPFICQNEQIAHGWWRANLTAYEELGTKHNYILGLKVDNLFDQVTDTTPCITDGTGCFPFNGPFSGIVDTPGSLIYQNYSQSPRTFYFFAGVKM